jgi:hypothetical protein
VTFAVLGVEVATRTNMFLRLLGCLKATMGASGRILYSLDFFFDASPMLTNGIEAFSQTKQSEKHVGAGSDFYA